MFRYFIIHKPYQVLSQFSPVSGKKTLSDYFPVPSDVYPLGRLDYDSEGLLLLSNDASLNQRLLHPRFAHEREYLVQVEGAISNEALRKLEEGVVISLQGKPYRTRPARASLCEGDPGVTERVPPIRFRKTVPESWIRLRLQEGKNRQVRKMTAATGFPTLRLIRTRIAGIELGDLAPGHMSELPQELVYRLLLGEKDKAGDRPASKHGKNSRHRGKSGPLP